MMANCKDCPHVIGSKPCRTRGVSSESREELHVPVGKTLAELDGRLCMMRDVRHRTDLGGLLFEIWKLQD
jgi:hypothetical protein